ncbi:MAG: sigma-70 family RNA polymerase sigma factor [Verrucomicrobiota bacterium]|jgi:RNA polymerase sigma factor (sigma-70 family)
MTSDLDLLGQFTRDHSQDAFTALVSRHVNLVYSAALRQVRSPQLAEEVAQSVFADLARNAGKLKTDTILTAWLYQVTRRTAIDVVRRESRRQLREQMAVEMNTINATASDWTRVEPFLDEAMHMLDDTDRAAVLLRYFENKSFREVGQALGTSDDDAQKRVSRAVERLREFFTKRNVTIGASGLVVVISANAIQAAPAGLAAGISSAALAAAAGTGTTLTLLKLMTMTKLQTAIIGALVVAGVATPLVVQHQAKLREQNQSLRQQIAQIKADNEGLALQVAQLKHAPAPRPPAPRVEVSSATNPPVAQSPYEQLSEFLDSHHELAREEIEAYLQQNKRNAESLLAAYRMSHDQSYLREAATNFPNTPFVQFAIIADKVFPEEQRQWIDAFKASSPDNALAWYFSALDYFNSKQPDLAIRELAEATRRQSFDTYAAQASQAVEEMCDLAGWPPLAAKAWAPSSESASYLPSLKNLGNQIMQTQQQNLTQGDAASANSLASMGMVLGNSLLAGNPIDQLVGIAIEQKMLAQLDPAVNYDFLGRPVSEVLAELDRQKQAIRDALNARDQVLPTLNEAELASYFERKKLYGEVNALLWLQSKYHQP